MAVLLLLLLPIHLIWDSHCSQAGSWKLSCTSGPVLGDGGEWTMQVSPSRHLPIEVRGQGSLTHGFEFPCIASLSTTPTPLI